MCHKLIFVNSMKCGERERESPTKESIVKVFYGLFSLVRVLNKLFDKEIIKSILNLFCVFLNIVTFNK